jgi:hypothetical protein
MSRSPTPSYSVSQVSGSFPRFLRGGELLTPARREIGERVSPCLEPLRVDATRWNAVVVRVSDVIGPLFS